MKKFALAIAILVTLFVGAAYAAGAAAPAAAPAPAAAAAPAVAPAAALTCNLPELTCGTKKAAVCTVTCTAPKHAECKAGACAADGKAVKDQNKCECK